MKKVYIKPELKAVYNIECNLMSNSEPRSDDQLSKENGWEDFEEITPLYDKTWGTGDNTWNEEEE